MENINIVECSPIEGFKVLKSGTHLKEKVNLINRMSKSGVQKIQVASFIHPKLFPQLADAEEIVKLIDKQPGVIYGGLAPNEIACRRAISTGLDEISVVIAASDTYNNVTFGHSTRKLINKILPSIIKIVLNEGKSVRAYIATSLGCPYEGNVPISKVSEIASKLDFLGVNQISIGDSLGVGNPKSVREVISSLIGLDLKAELAVHFHDVRGMGLVNAMAAFESGIRTFDTAVGGMSEKPFGAPDQEIFNWNIPTEDLVNMFESIEVKTGIDMDVLLSCVSMAEKMYERKCSGHILRAGVNNKLFKPPEKLKLSDY